LENLLKLQELDLRIERLHAREVEIPKQKRRFDIHRQRLKSELEASDKRVKDLALEQRAAEGEVADKEELIRKYETQLASVKKNDEYTALLHEIDIQKKQIGVKEERILQIMDDLEAAKAQFAEDKKRIEKEQQEIEAACKDIDKELEQAVGERKAEEAKRKPLQEAISSSLLKRYERIRRSIRSGAIVVPIRGESCSGCHMAVTPQVVNELLAGEKMHSCTHCGRLLYHADNFEESTADAGS
jgi:hypothetical protein